MLRHIIATAALLGATSSAAFAHVGLETREAPVAAGYKAVFRVPHGCKGAATVKLRVQIPNGVIAVKPMPKPGWSLETVKGKYDKAYPYYHGAMLSEGVKEVSWSGGKLLDEHYDEFVLQAFLTADLKPDTTLYFPVVQECDQGTERWIEIPEGGKSAADYEKPAPGVKLLPAK
jgi:periplasmic copper chaperone A